ncbi:helix-turn-helix domain-containing protein [Herbidospora yilanensis]|uniref:helix-turn-helix domain-containing protein n=1 Tax=Herbidospora yilanensis TaxID=354426 RepID=UPI000781539E|nr:helix-turn-helix transcriptional regulator [Herbidospora yilanensis]
MTFGEKLRDYRTHAGKSLNVLARESSCSKSYLSRLESGERRPSPEVAAHLDTLLDAKGALQAAARDDRGRLHPKLVHGADEAAYGDVLLTLWELGRRRPARLVLNMVRATVADLDGARAADVAGVAAHLTEYASWMAQESGDTADAFTLITATADLARRGSARDLEAYVWVRRAELLMDDPRQAAELAAGVRGHRGVSPRIQGLAALTQAKALALTGPSRAVEDALDAGAALLTQPGELGPYPVGPSTVGDEAAAAAGWSLFDLGRTAGAVTRLTTAIDGSPPDGHRARSLLGARLARAHLDLGDLKQAAAVVRTALDMARRTGSASARAELRLFARDLRHWAGDPLAQTLRAEIAVGLTG